MFGKRLNTSVSPTIVMIASFAAPANAQSPPPGGLAPVCLRPAITCPPPNSNNSWVQINVVPNGSSCWFDPRTIPDLETSIGNNVYWTFCSTCPLDTRIELEAPGPNGPFGQFQSFVPQPESDNLVRVDMPCNDYAYASGFGATNGGQWKYNLILQPTGVGQPLDRIDPRLEIDDTYFTIARWLERILLIVLGLLVGAYLRGRLAR